jgi:Protein of unknown function (DUF1580)
VEANDMNRLLPIGSVVDLPVLTRAGRTLHRSTPARWALYGLNGVRLETTKIAGRRFTSAAAVMVFLERCTTASRPGVPEQAAPQDDNQE